MRIKKSGGRRVAILGLAVGLLGGAQVVSAQIPCGGYEVTAIIQVDECPPFGFPPTLAEGLNEQGWVVGWFRACVIGPDVAWLWTPELGLQVIPTPQGTTYSKAVAISGSLIVGEFDNPNELGRTGFLYDLETDQFTSLGTLPGGNWSEARAINSIGEIAGFWGNNLIGPWQAFIWENGTMIDLGPSIGGANNRGLAIDDNRAITGWSQREDNGDRIAFLWDDGRVTSLGPIPGGFTSEGRAINTMRQIVGRGKIEEDGVTLIQAFLWENNRFTDLGTLPGFDRCAAIDINDSSTIIGGCDQSDNPNNDQLFVWSQGVIVNLNDLVPDNSGVNITAVSAINNSGQIAATAVDEFGDVVGVVLTPVEDPLGDLNRDCVVGAADLLILLASWGPCDDCGNCPADLNSDCVVGGADLLTLLANWG